MTEIISIILQIFYFIFLSLFPINVFNNNKYFQTNKFSFLDKISSNNIIHLNILLFLSLLKLDFQLIFILQIVLGIAFLFFFFKDNINLAISNIYLILFIFITNVILSIVIASNLTLGWDADFRWIMKALNFVQGNNVDNLQSFTDNEYPFLGSLIWGYFWKNSLLGYEYFGRLYYLYLFIISIFTLSDVLKTSLNYKISITLIVIFLVFKYSHFNGYQDVLIFSILCLISKHVFYNLFTKNIRSNKFRFDLIILILLFNSIFWIKHEGMIYSLFFLILYFIFSKNYKHNFILLFSTLSIFVFKYLTYENLNLPFIIQGETYDKSLYDFDLNILISRFFIVTKYYFIFIFDNLIMIINFMSLSLIFLYEKNFRILKIFILFFILNISFIYGSHLLMNLQNLDYWIKYSIGRFIFHTSGFYLLAFFIICNIRLAKFLK